MRVPFQIVRFALAAAVAVSVASISSAQEWRGKARIDGRVVNEQGQGITGAKLTLRYKGAGPDAVTTDKKGRWAYLGLVGGSWDVDVEAPGYQPFKTTVQLSEINRIPPMDIKLQAVPQAAAQPAAAAGGAAPKGASPDVIPILTHGNELLQAKDYAGARAEYEKALPMIPAESTAPVHRAIAQTYYGEKKMDEAVAALQKVIAIDPADATALLLLADLQIEKGNFEEGKATLAKLPPDSIKDPGVYTNLGIILLNKKKPEDAWTYFDQAVKIAPTDADVYYYRGLAAYQIKTKKAEAKTDFLKYLELAPTGENAADVKEYLKTLK